MRQKVLLRNGRSTPGKYLDSDLEIPERLDKAKWPLLQKEMERLFFEEILAVQRTISFAATKNAYTLYDFVMFDDF